MDYRDSVGYLESYWKFGIKLGLDRITRLLFLLGDPQNKFRSVHVAGTNGKGSVCTMVSSILTDAGYKTGLFTSPHLIEYTERIKTDGKDITAEEFAGLIGGIKDLICREYGDFEKPTEFELLTAAAFKYFADKKVDIAVVEVGLGGRLDSTNVITPLVSAITNVERDHMHVLGDDLGEIAVEKAGIIKHGIPLVTAAKGIPLDIITRTCAGLGSPLDIVTDADVEKDYSDALSLKGGFQIMNAAVALGLIRRLRKNGFRIDNDSEKKGLAKAEWPGRFQVLQQKPLVILDGAHNEAGAKALAKEILKLRKGRKLSFVIGALADKDYKTIVRLLATGADSVFAAGIDNPRSCDPVCIAEEAAKYCREVKSFKSVREAFGAAKAMAGEMDMVVAAGSLFLAGEVLAVYR